MASAAGAVEVEQDMSVCELLDRVLNKGVVVVGEIVLSVADIDLVYLAVQIVLTSVEKAQEVYLKPEESIAGR